MSTTTDEDARFLAMLEDEMKSRFTENDPEYLEYLNREIPTPPIVELTMKRKFYNDRDSNRSYNNEYRRYEHRGNHRGGYHNGNSSDHYGGGYQQQRDHNGDSRDHYGGGYQQQRDQNGGYRNNGHHKRPYDGSKYQNRDNRRDHEDRK